MATAASAAAAAATAAAAAAAAAVARSRTKTVSVVVRASAKKEPHEQWSGQQRTDAEGSVAAEAASIEEEEEYADDRPRCLLLST